MAHSYGSMSRDIIWETAVSDILFCGTFAMNSWKARNKRQLLVSILPTVAERDRKPKNIRNEQRSSAIEHLTEFLRQATLLNNKAAKNKGLSMGNNPIEWSNPFRFDRLRSYFSKCWSTDETIYI